MYNLEVLYDVWFSTRTFNIKWHSRKPPWYEYMMNFLVKQEKLLLYL